MNIPFGKHRGTSIDVLAETDPGYLRWALESSSHDFIDYYREDIEEALANAQLKKLAAVERLPLTPHQQEVADQLKADMETSRVVRLSGGAGYGKSFTTQEVVAHLLQAGISVRACAVSYVASQVLAQQLDPLGCETGTVARTLRQAKVYENDQEKYILTPDSHEQARALLSPGAALIVDEDSMINDEIADLLISSAEAFGGTLVLVGDEHQLPPVKQERLSKCCAVSPVATLTEPMRYSKESDLYAVEQRARHNQASLPSFFAATMNPESEQLFAYRSGAGIIDAYVDRYTREPAATHRMLLFQRNQVISANNMIRERLYGADAGVVEDGETLMILRTSDFPYVENAAIGDTQRFYSGQSYQATDVTKALYQTTIDGEQFTIPHYVVAAEGIGSPARVIFGVSEVSSDHTKPGSRAFDAAKARARALGKETGDWKPYFRLQNDFVTVAYQYATTVHRAQGQTVDYAYVAPKQLLSVKGLLGPALTYVALTRARKELHYVW